MKRAPRRRKTKKTSVSHRVRPRFLDIGDTPVETNVTFWLIHASHWCILLFAVIGILVIGSTLFAKQ